ncbi:Hypothetical predicted protein [Mytilus galloprovincialis]|uniref:Integrase catalytic domain-containing protein n=1 Tax=Mytilus galloprovincialis TaxID=29158 RepID=A0A8B6CP77_MYTGA|nr:Hypothetical predicted protein [Mytilus galloprovincialis]
MCDLLEVSKTRTSAYHPASNGQVERYNRIITQLIRCFLKKTQNRWDIHLQQLAGAIRATENRQTGFTPNFHGFRTRDRKREEVVHHDRLKLCIDREIPLWLQRLRNDILGRAENKLERDTNMELEDLYLDILFSGENQNTQNGLNPLSESLTDDFDNNDPFLVSDSLTNNSNNERIILKDLHSLIDIPFDLDATLAYDLSQNSLFPNSDDINRDTDKLDNGSKQGQVGRRKRQMPSYLHDYVQ